MAGKNITQAEFIKHFDFGIDFNEYEDLIDVHNAINLKTLYKTLSKNFNITHK